MLALAPFSGGAGGRSVAAAARGPLPAPAFSAAPVYVALDAVGHRKTLPPATSGAVIPRNLTVSATQIPRRVLRAYVQAAATLAHYDAGCGVTWYLLAGIGYIESDHARSGGSATPRWDGRARPAILGPPVQVDGTWVRALGPMQFIPSTWATWGADGNRDGRKDPQQVDDATLAAADYLCGVEPTLDTPDNLIRAIYAYNHSYDYVRAVLRVAAQYGGVSADAMGYQLVPADPAATPAARHRGKPTNAVVASSAAAPSGSPIPTPGGTPTPSLSPTSSPTPSASPTASATASASPSGSPSPTASPDASPSTTPSPTADPSP